MTIQTEHQVGRRSEQTRQCFGDFDSWLLRMIALHSLVYWYFAVAIPRYLTKITDNKYFQGAIIYVTKSVFNS